MNTTYEVDRWLDTLKGYIKFYKIGLELFVSHGMAVVDRVLDAGCHVMLDLKLYDIPKTVNRTVKQICKRRVDFF